MTDRDPTFNDFQNIDLWSSLFHLKMFGRVPCPASALNYLKMQVYEIFGKWITVLHETFSVHAEVSSFPSFSFLEDLRIFDRFLFFSVWIDIVGLLLDKTQLLTCEIEKHLRTFIKKTSLDGKVDCPLEDWIPGRVCLQSVSSLVRKPHQQVTS